MTVHQKVTPGVELTPALEWIEGQLRESLDKVSLLEGQLEGYQQAAAETGKGGKGGGDGGKSGKGGGTGWLNKAAEFAAAYSLGLWERTDELLDMWKRNDIFYRRTKTETKRLSLLSGNARPLALPSSPPPDPPPPHKPFGSPGVWWERAVGGHKPYGSP